MSSLTLVGAHPSSPSLHTLPSRLSFSRREIYGSYSFLFSPTASWSLSATISLSPVPLVICGRGDRKTAKGKRFSHSFGNARPRKKNKGRGPPRIPLPPSPQKVEKFKAEVEEEDESVDNGNDEE